MAVELRLGGGQTGTTDAANDEALLFSGRGAVMLDFTDSTSSSTTDRVLVTLRRGRAIESID